MSHTLWAKDGSGRAAIIVAGISRSAAEAAAASVHELITSYAPEATPNVWVEED